MNLAGLLDVVRRSDRYQDALTALPTSPSFGLIQAARPVIAAALAADTPHPTVIVTARVDSAYNIAEQLIAWDPSLQVLSFAEPSPLFYERAPWSDETIRARLQVLSALATGGSSQTVVVTSARALMQRTLGPQMLQSRTMILRRGGQLPSSGTSGLLRQWLDMGYAPATLVTQPGTYSRRGGIIDVYPVAGLAPVRIELWGDEIESLRTFDPASQRSMDPVEHVIITPGREALPGTGPAIAEQLAGWFDNSVDETRADERLALENGGSFPTLEFYLPWMLDEVYSLVDYIPEEALLLVDDWQDLAVTIADLEEQALDLRANAEAAGDIPPEMPLPLVTWAQLADDLTARAHVQLGGPVEESHPLGDAFQPGPRFAGQLKLALDDFATQSSDPATRQVIVSRQATRLAELWSERRLGPRVPVHEDLDDEIPTGEPVFVQGALREGWIMDGGIRLYADSESFGGKRPEPRRRPQRRAVAPEAFFADLAEGDYVVHTEYGIGRFEGLNKRTLDGNEREFLLVSFEGGDILYVPIHQADRLNRYVGPDDSPPSLSRLGTQDWNRVKNQTREAVEAFAEDLLDLYAARESVQGYAFNPDTPWQLELEASFPYVETADQMRAINEVKADMEQYQPMDRLICGDVGYGKTEVALRAAFKAIMDGKQVAMLVPTTVLAQQHYETFTQRLAPFPANVELLSRFRTRAEQAEVIAGLVAGGVDFVIGTHRLLGKDVEFHDLGLLIIDEEQRFGVTHKERLKQMRTEVDVLTLTASPIPRTLYMSLTGVRDISMITTAPEDRLPVVTHVGRKDNDLIRQAILREMDRGGQVFYVHNRVRTIHSERERLEKLVPGVRAAVGHGQMNEHELEDVMDRFASGEIDVLVTTTIIEAGLDIPNANTLIVDRADRFGLSQLYQLRGRVGRSAMRAYAYFFHPALNTLTDEARARLQTIAEHTGLGSGFNIAMRDLEIRGAGDILGARQSGHISAVGVNLYTRMLADAVRRLRDQRDMDEEVIEEAPREVVTIELPIPTYIPTDYIPDMALRVQLYRRMADLSDEESLQEFAAELADRFGEPPPAVQNLLYQLRVKRHALAARVDAVLNEGEQVSIKIPGLAFVDRRALQERLGHNVRVSRTAVWLPRNGDGSWQRSLLTVLDRLRSEAISVPAG
ncbi:MAG: transcription-repair coupling factor [Anaerolineae bacterium]